jgi:hypothetical protein
MVVVVAEGGMAELQMLPLLVRAQGSALLPAAAVVAAAAAVVVALEGT